MIGYIVVVAIIIFAFFALNFKLELIDLNRRYVDQHSSLIKLQQEIIRQQTVVDDCKANPTNCKNPSAVVAQSATLNPLLTAERSQVDDIIKRHSDDIQFLNEISCLRPRGSIPNDMFRKLLDYQNAYLRIKADVDNQQPRIADMTK